MLTRSPLRTLSLEHVFLACEQVTNTEYNMKFSTLGQLTQIQTGDQFNLNKLNIGQINICSLKNKMNEVKIMLETNQFDILAVCETHLSKKIGNRQLQVDGYRTIRRDRPDGRNNDRLDNHKQSRFGGKY